MPHRPALLDWLLLAALVVAWGSSFVMSKVALQSIDAGWIAATRLTIGAGVVLVFAAAHGKLPAFDIKSLATYIWLGFIGNAAPFLAITWGMLHISSGVAGLLMGTIPLFILVMAHFTLPNERLTLTRAIAFVSGFIGVMALIGPSEISNFAISGDEFIGQLAVLAGCMMYGINSITAKMLSKDDYVKQSAGVLLWAAVISVLAAVWSGPFTLMDAPVSALWATFGLGVLPTGIATLVWFKAMTRNGPTFVSMSNYLVPVYAVVFGAVLLNERIGWNVLVAMAFILSGIFVSTLRPQPSK
jgi:drug/metabolite transporter (DMT)-like permease